MRGYRSHLLKRSGGSRKTAEGEKTAEEKEDGDVRKVTGKGKRLRI